MALHRLLPLIFVADFGMNLAQDVDTECDGAVQLQLRQHNMVNSRTHGSAWKRNSRMFGDNDPWWWRAGWTGRTVSLYYNEDVSTTENLKAYAKKLHDEGTYTLTLMAAYDSGLKGWSSGCDPYCPGDLWGGMAISDLHASAKVLGDDGVQDLVDYVHNTLGMKIMTWVNPSYVWTGAPLFSGKGGAVDQMKACIGEQDWWTCTNQFDAADHYAEAKYFKWMGNAGDDSCADIDLKDGTSRLYKPAPNSGYPQKTNCSNAVNDVFPCWVYDPDAQRCYASHWGSQPTGDFGSVAWTDYVKKGFDRLIEQGFDGFILDAPDFYIYFDSNYQGYAINDDNGAAAVVDAVTGHVHEKGQYQVATFIETYASAWKGTRLQTDFNLAGEYASTCGTAIAEAILGQGTGKMSVEDGFNCVDAYLNQAYRTDVYTAAWQRPRLLNEGVQLDSFYPSANLQEIGLESAGGYFVNIEVTQQIADFTDNDNTDWFSSNPWFGESYPKTNRKFNDLYQFMLNSDAFMALSLRTDAKPRQDPWAYAMIRYDAINRGSDHPASGAVGIYVANLHSDQFSFKWEDAFEPAILAAMDGSPVKAQMTINGGDADYTDGPHLPTWDKLRRLDGTAGLNCYEGKGSDLNFDQYEYYGNKDMALAACLLCCLHNSPKANPPGQCTSVTVKWSDWNTVQCWGKGLVNAEECEVTSDYDTFVLP